MSKKTKVQEPELSNDPVERATQKLTRAVADIDAHFDPWQARTVCDLTKVNAAQRALAQAKMVRNLVGEIEGEYHRAREKHRPMHSAHEGYAVLKEEVDELWDEIKAQSPNKARMLAEAIQVAAMALAFALEVCG